MVEAALEAGAQPLLRGGTEGNMFAPVVLEKVSTRE
jgi:hypothetical protein